jgi:hypothetical protein
MRKLIVSLASLITAFILCLPVAASADAAKGDMAIGAGLELALPMGTFGDYAGTGFGLTGQFEYVYSPNITIIGNLGYIKWGGKDFGVYKWSNSAIPVKGGAKYYLDPTKKGFYGAGELGFYFFSSKYEYTQNNVTHRVTDSSTDLSLALMGGYEMPAGESWIVDLSARIEIISDHSFLGLRVGVKKPIGKK